jgi:hypothetical protein
MQYRAVIGTTAPNPHLFHYVSLLLVGILFLIDAFPIYAPLAQEHNYSIKHWLPAYIYIKADAQIAVGRGFI